MKRRSASSKLHAATHQKAVTLNQRGTGLAGFWARLVMLIYCQIVLSTISEEGIPSIFRAEGRSSCEISVTTHKHARNETTEPGGTCLWIQR
jgi:hypothetical protein